MLSYSRACDLLYAVAQSGDQTKKEDLAHTPLKHFYKTGPYDVDAEVLPRTALCCYRPESAGTATSCEEHSAQHTTTEYRHTMPSHNSQNLTRKEHLNIQNISRVYSVHLFQILLIMNRFIWHLWTTHRLSMMN